MLRIGLTGGIATGKSTVATMLRDELDLAVIDADVVARQVVLPGEPALADILEAFGEGILQKDGTLNRKALGSLVMNDPTSRLRLNHIMHPRILEHLSRQVDALAASGAKACIVEAALMVETGSYRTYDKLLVVTCSPKIQRARLIAREGLSPAEADKWISSQMPLDQKEAVADHVIQNDGDLKDLRQQVLRFWDWIQGL